MSLSHGSAGPHAVRVAFQGEPGAFGEDAIHDFFGRRARPVPCPDFDDVRLALLTGTAEYGVLPLENSIAGTVATAAAILRSVELEVLGHVIRPIRQCLLALPGTALDDLRLVRSHPTALAQCTRFLAAHPCIQPVSARDTAGAARHVASAREPTHAAIAGHAAARRYGLAILAEDIQDRPDNRTRFVVVRRRIAR